MHHLTETGENMNLSFCSFASGSSGNCYLVKSREAAVLIDAGITTKRIHMGLEESGTARKNLNAVFVTHEHSDHVKGLKVFTKQNPGVKIYASEETCGWLSDKVHDQSSLKCICEGQTIIIGDMYIKPMLVSHDALHPLCYVVRSGDSQLIITTDTGYVPQDVFREMIRSDLIIIEANHEVNMLKAGPYPYHLKRRILGDCGHLSNETAGETIASVMKKMPKFRTILLAHLSRENNFPQLAYQTVKNILEESGFYKEKDYKLEVLAREGMSGVVNI